VLQQPEKGCYHTTMKEKIKHNETLIPRHILASISPAMFVTFGNIFLANKIFFKINKNSFG
jgi:hypothetical protein